MFSQHISTDYTNFAQIALVAANDHGGQGVQGLEDELLQRFESWYRGVGRGAGNSNLEASCLTTDSPTAPQATTSTATAAGSTVEKPGNDKEALLAAVEGQPAPSSVKSLTSHRRKRSHLTGFGSITDPGSDPSVLASGTGEDALTAAARVDDCGENDLEHQQPSMNGAVHSVNSKGRVPDASGRPPSSVGVPADGGKFARAGTGAVAAVAVEMEGVESTVLEPCRKVTETIRLAFAADREAVTGQLGLLAHQHTSNSMLKQCAGESTRATKSGSVQEEVQDEGGTHGVGVLGAGKDVICTNGAVTTGSDAILCSSAVAAGCCSPSAMVSGTNGVDVDAVSAGMSEAELCERSGAMKGAGDTEVVGLAQVRPSAGSTAASDSHVEQAEAGAVRDTDVLECHDLAGAVDSLQEEGHEEAGEKLADGLGVET